MPHRFLKSRKGILIALVVLLCAAVFFYGSTVLREYQLYQGQKSLKERDISIALERFKTAERIDPDHAETHFLLARGYRLSGKSELFHNHLEQALRLGFPRERLEREQWLALAQSGQLKLAEPFLSELLKDPEGDGPAICEAYVAGYLLNYKFDKAFQLLDAWQADHPDDSQPHVFRGTFLEHVSDWKGAVKEYREAHELAPKRQDVVLRLARLLTRLHQYDEASQLYRKSLKRNSKNPDVLLGWGKCMLGMGKKEEAREILQRAIDISADRFETKLAMGQLEQSSGQPQEAMKWLLPAVEERPYDVEARYALALVIQETGDADAAREHFQFVADAEKGMLKAQLLIGKIRVEPDNFELRFQLGQLLLQYDNPNHGAAWLRSVLELKPEHQAAHRALADYYHKQGNKKLAEQHRVHAGDPPESDSVPGRNDSFPRQKE